jgi:hypothetical protein
VGEGGLKADAAEGESPRNSFYSIEFYATNLFTTSLKHLMLTQ